MDGSVEMLRPFEKQGAGVRGDNGTTIHVCLIKDGKDPISPAQKCSLFKICLWLIKHYKLTNADVWGHYEYWTMKEQKPLKSCPNMDIDVLRRELKIQLKLVR